MTNLHSPTPSPHEEDAFAPILDFVRLARGQALAAVNRELVALYWRMANILTTRLQRTAGGKVRSSDWPTGWWLMNPVSGDSPRKIFGGCASSTRPTEKTQFSHQW